MGKILVIGASGQIGSELTLALRAKYGEENVVASDIKESNLPPPFVILDVMDSSEVRKTCETHNITEVYLLAALLSATAEKHPKFAWDLNMQGLFNVLDLAKEGLIKKVFWPSSIAVFGPTTPSEQTPQDTIMDPNTVYGISKQAGERWCEYYHQKHGVDVRSIRYPGLISYKTAPGGGTTDYAIDIFIQANAKGRYTSFLSENTRLPMLFMDDAVRATIELMETPAEQLSVHSSYNLGGLDFTPGELAQAIRQHLPNFEIDYNPDFRQKIANSWPSSINDTIAQKDWNWRPDVSLQDMVEIMLKNC